MKFGMRKVRFFQILISLKDWDSFFIMIDMEFVAGLSMKTDNNNNLLGKMQKK